MRRIVIKVAMKGQKSHSKAMKVVGGLAGVGSVAFAGKDDSLIVVTGEGLDAVELTRLLRRKVGSSELVSVGPAEYGGDAYSMGQIPVGGSYSYPNGYESGGYGYETKNQNSYLNGPGYGYEMRNQNSYPYGPGYEYETKNQNSYPYGQGYGYEMRNQNSYPYGPAYGYENPNTCSIM